MHPKSVQGGFFYGWVIVLLGFSSLAFAGGIWSGFGVFFKPLLAEFGVARGRLSLIITVGMIFWAAGAFLAGTLVNRFGARRLNLFGVGLMGLGCLLSSFATSAWALFATYSLLVATGTGLATMTTNAVLISRWFVRSRGKALAISIAGYNAGQLLLVPFSQFLIGAYGWHWTFIIWAGMLWGLLAPAVYLFLRESPEKMGLSPDGAATSESGPAKPIDRRIAWIPRGEVREALRTRSFWLLFASYVACGFTDFVIYVHFPILATGIGVSEQTAANAFGLIGGLSIIGVLWMGAWADRIGYRAPLVMIYAIRCVGILLLGLTDSVVMLFGVVVLYGLFHQATTPLTPGMSAHLFGRNPLGTLHGYMLIGHSLGALMGPYAAGATFDATGSYRLIFFLTAGLLAGASACCAAIKSPPVKTS